jgi:hypothetical protein
MKIINLRGEWGRVSGGPLGDPVEDQEPVEPAYIEGEEAQEVRITLSEWILEQVQYRKGSGKG